MPIGQTTFQKGASLSAKCRIVAQAGLFQQKQRLPAYHKDKYKHKYKGNDKDKGKYNEKKTKAMAMTKTNAKTMQ